ncbi:MAG: hypothetical protein GX375_00150 [Clostridiales bacterium]|nr:hypothetical protein [Clostridiales bacterium]
MNRSIYIQLRGQIKGQLGQTIYLKDIAHLSCPWDIKEKIEDLVVLTGNDIGVTLIDAVEIIEIVRQAIPSVSVFSVGEKQVSIYVDRIGESRKVDLKVFVKVAISSLLLFVGSGLALMYFHADVNMHEVHEVLITAVTGEESISPYWINIPYSIGIGLGIALFFGLFPDKKRVKHPDPLEIEMHKYQMDVESYLEYKEGQKSGEK